METDKEQELWKIAKKRVSFKRQLGTYIIINGMFWLLWYFTDHTDENSGVPWPIFPMLGWGIGLLVSFLKAYVFVSNDAVEKEYEKLKQK